MTSVGPISPSVNSVTPSYSSESFKPLFTGAAVIRKLLAITELYIDERRYDILNFDTRSILNIKTY